MTEKQRQLVRDALVTVSPFALRSEKGRLIIYESAKECYQLLLTGLFAECPAGFIGLAYYMMKYQRLTPGQAWNILGRREYAAIRWWDKEDPERVPTLRRVLRSLLRVSGCDLDEDLMQQALENLDSMIDRQGVRENISKLHNIKFI